MKLLLFIRSTKNHILLKLKRLISTLLHRHQFLLKCYLFVAMTRKRTRTNALPSCAIWRVVIDEPFCLSHGLSIHPPVTPQDYQPPGFKEADSDTLEFGKEMVELTMGQVATPFHSLKVDMSTERHRLEQVIETKLETGAEIQIYIK